MVVAAAPDCLDQIADPFAESLDAVADAVPHRFQGSPSATSTGGVRSERLGAGLASAEPSNAPRLARMCSTVSL